MRYESVILSDIRTRLEMVEAENAELRALLGFDEKEATQYRVLGISPAGCHLMAALMARPMATLDALRFALHKDDADRRVDLCDNLVKVQICLIRKQLAPHGVNITTVWGHGYRLSSADKGKVRELVKRLS